MNLTDVYAENQRRYFDEAVTTAQALVRQTYQPVPERDKRPRASSRQIQQAKILQNHATVLFCLGKDAPAPDVIDRRYEEVTTKGAELWHWSYSTFWYEQRRVFFSRYAFYMREEAVSHWLETVAALATQLEQDRLYEEAWLQEFAS